MKTSQIKLIIFILLFCGVTSVLFAQDVITKKDKTIINGKVIELGLDEIKYTMQDNPDGPIISIDKTDVLKVKFATGGEWFNTPDPYSVSAASEVRDKTRSIKFEFFSPVLGKLTFGYEQMLKVGTNIELKLGIIGPSLSEAFKTTNPSGAFIKIGPKFLLGSEYKMRGISYTHPLVGKYFKPEIIYSSFKQDYDGYNGTNTGRRYNTSSFAVMLNYGRQYILANFMTLDWYVGLGLGLQSSGLNELNQQYYGQNQYYYDEASDFISNCYSHIYGGPNFPMTFAGGLTIGFLAR